MKKVTSLRISLAPVFLGSLIPGLVSTWAQVLRNITLRVALLAVVCIVTSLTLYAQPTITSFSPTSGVVGTTVTITGTGFNTTPANNVVFFGATRATVSAATATSLTVTVPAGATYAPITELNTGTTLAAYSMAYFTPVFSPAKAGINTSDFATKVSFAVGANPKAIAIGDLDGDGLPDLAVPNASSNTLSILRNTGSGFSVKVDFTTGSTTPWSVAIGDIDGDGKLDLAVSHYNVLGTSSVISVFRNTSSSGSISFAARVDLTTSKEVVCVAISDLDGDGKPDLAYTDFNSATVSVFRNTGSTGSISFATKQDFTAGTSPLSVAIGDLDGDGKLDLAVSNFNSSTISVFRNIGSSGSISFATKQDFTAGTNPYNVAIGDLDGDGKLDLAITNDNSATVSVFRNTGSSGTISFATKQDFTASPNSEGLAIGDMDGDGKPDLVVSNTSLLRNTGSSGTISFAAKVDLTIGANPKAIAIGDLDGDGLPDLAAPDDVNGIVSVLRNLPYCITVSGSTGADGTYTSLGAAFTAINNNTTQTGNNIVITVIGSPTETATAALNAGNWTSLKIYPTATGLNISGNLSAPLIQLNGADNVTIDGRVNATGTPSSASDMLTIVNPSATTASTIQFINGACNNTVQYCTLKGAAPAGYGVVMFSTSSASYGATTGNYIQNNNITNSGTRPINAIYSAGTASYSNDNNYIQNNNIYDFLNASTASYGINLSSNTSGWSITGNSFYETASFAPSASVEYRLINILAGDNYTITGNTLGGNGSGGVWTKSGTTYTNNFYGIYLAAATTAATSVQNNTIGGFAWPNGASTSWYGINSLGAAAIGTTTGNVIGGTLATTVSSNTGLVTFYGISMAGGTASNNTIGGAGGLTITSTAGAGVFYGINNTGASSSITGNTVGGGTIMVTNSGAGTFYGIRNTGTSATITGNTIGATTGTGVITVTNSTTGGNCYGINSTGGTVSNNNIGAITAAATATMANNLYGIYTSGTTACTINNNNIGSTTTTSSLNASSGSTSNVQTVYGIYNSSTGTIGISGNTIANLTNGSTNTTVGTAGLINGIYSSAGANTIINNSIHDLTIANANTSATNTGSVGGIVFSGTGAVNTATGNTIYNLGNTYASFAGQVAGIYFTGSTGANVCSGNFIHDLTVTGASSTTANIYGIKAVSGATTYSNNIISLGGNTKTTLYGLYDTGAASQTCNLYFNTIYLGGTLASGSTNKSYCLYSLAASNTRNYRNNLLVNGRSTTGGSSLHYAISLTANTNLTCNYNDYYASGTGGVLGYLSSDRATLSAWQTATTQDGYSLNVSPSFVNAGGSAATDYIPSYNKLCGISGTGITTDYTTATRTYNTMGAYDVYTVFPVEVWKGGILQAPYNTLYNAFAAINAGTHTGDLVVKINDNTTETATAVLNASGSGSASYTSINIYPTTTGLSVSGNLAAPLINLNGADNVTIDGRVNATGSTKDLTIVNNSTSTAAGTSTIRFIADASNNTVKYCTIKGSEMVANSTTTGSGTIFFSTGTTTGNINNTIDSNNITCAADASRPLNSIYSLGSSNTIANTGNTISNNWVYNFFCRTWDSYGIYLGNYTSGWGITGNSFYETATDVGVRTYYVIYISNTSGTGFTVNNNYIGGSTASCGGSAWTKNNTTPCWLKVISMSVGTGTASSVQGNTIRNFNWTESSNGWVGIELVRGDINVGTDVGNTIGSGSGTGSIIYTANPTGSAFLNGIQIGSAGTINCSNNTIGGITTTSGNGNPVGFFGIYGNGSTATIAIDNNTIGSTTTANSVDATNILSGTTYQGVLGIYCYASSANVTVTNNTIANLTNRCQNSGGTAGMYVWGGNTIISGNTVYNLTTAEKTTSYDAFSGITSMASTLSKVFGNTIYNLSNTNASSTEGVAGITFSASVSTGPNVCNANFIHDLTVSSSAASVYGIYKLANPITISNNIVTLGAGTTTACTLYGIYETGSASYNSNIYFNTVYLGGSPTSGAYNSYALYNAVTTNTRDFRNNLLINARSNSGTATGKHYAIWSAGATGLTCNFNDYYVTGTGGVLGYIGGDKATLSAWQTATGQDGYSLNVSPSFANAGGSAATDYIPSYNRLCGITGTGITTDYTTAARIYNSMGAYDVYTILPVEVWKSGVLQATYLTLYDAFTAINAGTHTGDLEIRITGSINEYATAVLNASGSGSASYTSINIYPTVSGLSISGSFAAPLIDLNGADNVTIDGRVNATGSDKDLTIVNNSTSSTAGTSTIRFIADASNNTVKYCNIKGSETVANSTTTGSGIVFFSTGTTSGNDNNTIDSNNITCAADANRPFNAIFSLGSSNAIANTGITVSNNNIYDFFNRGIASYGINLGNYTSGWTISGNSFYETASFAPTASVAYNVIYISNTSGTGFTVSNNYIGGQAASCGGSAWTKTYTADNIFNAIYLNVGTGTASSVQGNTIQNFNWSNSAGRWYGIYLSAGDFNVGTVTGNTIGSGSGTGSISYTAATTGAIVYGVYINSTGTVNYSNNTIGGITGANGATLATNIYGIYKTAVAGAITISNNTIGSTTEANSINATSASTANPQSVYGIYNLGTGTNSISGNTIANLTNGTTNATVGTAGLINGIYSSAGTNTVSGNTIRDLTIANANTSATYTCSVGGIVFSGTGAVNTATGNTIYYLSNTYALFAGQVAGIYFTGNTGANVCSGNFIHDLTVTGASSTTANIYGIKAVSGATTYSNNIISLGGNTKTTLYGLYDTGAASQTCNLYFNTIYLGGTLASGSTNKSYCLYSLAASNTRNYRNNLLVNGRSTTGGSSLHYAISLTANTNLTCNYNDYYASGTGGVLGYLSSDRATLSAWQTATTQDGYSLNVSPSFVNAGGSTATNYAPQTSGINGTNGTGITTDYFGVTRSNYTMGAIEQVKATVTTQAVSGISTTTATGNGTITSLGTPNPTAYGVCWSSTNATPTTSDSKVDNGAATATGAFTAAMTGLTPGTLYYVRAYATNGGGTAYGDVVTFTTYIAPTVTTQAVSAITTTAATGNGNITSLGIPASVTSYGVCWSSTNATPTTSDSMVDKGAAPATGAFTAAITGLTPGTTYYVRAFATNTAGTSYGAVVTFTSYIAPTVTTQAVSGIGATTATGNGNITSLGVPNPTAYGVCWSNTNATPTTSDSKADNGAATVTGAFTAGMTGLTPGTTYYVRAYATNAVTTSYGDVVTFTSYIAPTVTTQAVSGIGATTATGNGNITSLGLPNPTAYGVCWSSSNTNPTTSDSKVDNGAATVTGAFTAAMTGLTPGTLYYVRAYATNGGGTSYGTVVTFTSYIAPTVTTQAVSGIGTTTATGNGNITSLGIPNPTAYGVCWSSTNATPTTSDSMVDNGAATATGAFTAAITGLTPGSLYYVRAYATNAAGTSYGAVVTFTLYIAPTVTTQAVSSISTTTATGNGNITSLGIPNPTAYGVCWSSTNATPTTSDPKADNGAATATGAFTAAMTGLTPGTLYYVRAYATNAAGTSYGAVVTFTSYIAPTVTTQAVSGIGKTTATGNGNITSLGVPNPTAYGVCWSSTNATPTTSDSKVDNGAATVTGAFTAAMTGLSPSTVYYVRAYATNAVSTVYGDVVSFDNTNYWKGATSSDWNTAPNWTLNLIPASGEDIYFAASPSNHCVMDQDRTIGSLYNSQSTYRLVTNGHKLTITGSFHQTGGAQVDASASGSTVAFAGSSAQTIPAGTFYNNQAYNLAVSNSNNVTLYGSLSLLGSLTATSGYMDATTQMPSVTYAGTSAQTLENNTWLNNQVYNLDISNTSGVTNNTSFTVSHNFTVNSGGLFTIAPAQTLTVNGTTANNAGNAGFVIGSTAAGTGSLLHNTDNVAATVNRYIDGAASAWHFLSAPVSGQTIHGTGWTPAGTYGDGTGYDLYVWDEPTSCWVYNLNATVAPTWASVHPSGSFVPGRGYLYALQATTPTKQFAGNLGNGAVNYSVSASATVSYIGFNFLGNPYPSSIDWNTDAGFSRSMLQLSGGGYDMWTWSNSADNYGVYNSVTGVGTNNITRYIAPMQGFMVRASSAGAFGFNNAARVHTGASAWLKSAETDTNEGLFRATVSSSAVKGQDEVLLIFGNEQNENGALKVFSKVATAPSLYLPSGNDKYTVRYLSSASDNKLVPLSFIAGKNGTYTLRFAIPDTMQFALLEDKRDVKIENIKQTGSYTFSSTTGDLADRFILHFDVVTPLSDMPVTVYKSGGQVVINAMDLTDKFTVRVIDTSGRCLFVNTMAGNQIVSLPLMVRGVFLVTVSTSTRQKSFKIVN